MPSPLRLHSLFTGLAAAAFMAVVGTALPSIAASPLTTQADDAIIVASSMPQYAPGMIVSDTDVLHLPEGAMATLLLQSGEMVRLRGPYEGVFAQADSHEGLSGVRLASAFRLRGVDATVIGGTRMLAMGFETPLMADIVIDPRRSTTWCVSASQGVWIARPGAASQVALRHNRSVRLIPWPDSADRIEWPSDLPIEDNDRYDVLVDGAAGATLTFRLVGPTAMVTPAKIAQGVVLGCGDQFQDALQDLSRSITEPAPWTTNSRDTLPTVTVGDRSR